MLRKPICPETLAVLYEQGESLKNIATRFDCDLKTITRRAAELGLRHPKAPSERKKKVHAEFRERNVIEHYQNGESLIELAESFNTSAEMLTRYLKRSGIKLRSRAEQVALTMQRYGTRFYKKEARLYAYERDAYGLVTKIKVYQNNNRKPAVRHVQ
jgi:transposase-like protein